MSDMELVEISRGHLLVKEGNRSVTILGEALLREYGSPDFVLYENSIGKWNAPDEHEHVTLAEKDELLKFLRAEFIRRKMQLEIEQWAC